MNGAAINVGASTLTCGPALSLLDALGRRLLSVSLGGSSRALTLCTTRDFVVAVSPSVSTRPLGSVCVSSHTHPWRRPYSTHRSTCKRIGNSSEINLSTRQLYEKLKGDLLPRRQNA